MRLSVPSVRIANSYGTTLWQGLVLSRFRVARNRISLNSDTGRSRRSVIGNHGRITPDEARSAAKRLLGAVEQGFDPVAAKRFQRSVPTFSEIASSFLESHVRAKRKPRTGEGY